jgi:ABC-2 type transport system permease protein
VAGLRSGRGGHLGAICFLRWHLFVNSLGSVLGRLNFIFRSLVILLVAGAAIGGCIGFGFAAWGLVVEGKLKWLPLPFWVICLFWQLFPIMATAFTHNVDISALLRFPLSYRAYFLVRLVLGALDIATALGLSWSLGLLIGASLAKPSLAGWALLAVASFVVFNLLLARMVFVWTEHWLGSRRSKEVMGVLVLLVMVGFQVAAPLLGSYSRQSAERRVQVLEKFLPAELVLPPGLTAMSIVDAAEGRRSLALFADGVIEVYAAAALWLLHLRLQEQYRGDNPRTGEKLKAAVPEAAIRRGWKLPLFSGPVSAVFEKELRYFSRSGPMVFTLIMPMVVVFILWGGRKAFLGQQVGFMFPAGAAYCLLIMTNIVYNSFGGDGEGVQFYLFSPIPFRQITQAKNLAQLVVLAIEVAILWLGVSAIYRPPHFRVVALTLAWLLFAVPVNFSVGNLLSVYSPKRIEYFTFGRQRASETTIVVSLLVQLGLIGMGALVLFASRQHGSLWFATTILLLLAVGSIIGYLILLSRIDRVALGRRDVLIAELCRT